MSSNAKELSHCCAFYSLIGAIFMLWVGVMITKQPFYIKGLEDVDHCRHSAFGAMWMFVLTFVASVTFLWYDRNRHRYAAVDYMLQRAANPRREYRDEDDGGWEDDERGGGLVTTQEGDTVDSTQVEPGCWNMRQRTARQRS